MIDAAKQDRQDFIARVQSRDYKVQEAIERMGRKWILHPANKIERKTPFQPKEQA